MELSVKKKKATHVYVHMGLTTLLIIVRECDGFTGLQPVIVSKLHVHVALHSWSVT